MHFRSADWLVHIGRLQQQKIVSAAIYLLVENILICIWVNNESLICSADDISKELKDEGKILKTSQVKEEKGS